MQPLQVPVANCDERATVVYTVDNEPRAARVEVPLATRTIRQSIMTTTDK